MASVVNGPRLPKESLRSRPRPLTAIAEFCIQRWKALRVSLVERLEDLVDLGRVLGLGARQAGRRRAAVGASSVPPVSSMKVSPSSVFWRRIARVSEGIGANFGSISIVDLGDVALLGQRELLDLADRDAADPHVGLLGQRHRLGERGA